MLLPGRAEPERRPFFGGGAQVPGVAGEEDGDTVVVFGEGRHALAFGTQKINLHEAGREFEPKASVPTPGSADLCFLTNSSVAQVVEHLEANSVEIIER